METVNSSPDHRFNEIVIEAQNNHRDLMGQLASIAAEVMASQGPIVDDVSYAKELGPETVWIDPMTRQQNRLLVGELAEATNDDEKLLAALPNSAEKIAADPGFLRLTQTLLNRPEVWEEFDVVLRVKVDYDHEAQNFQPVVFRSRNWVLKAPGSKEYTDTSPDIIPIGDTKWARSPKFEIVPPGDPRAESLHLPSDAEIEEKPGEQIPFIGVRETSHRERLQWSIMHLRSKRLDILNERTSQSQQ